MDNRNLTFLRWFLLLPGLCLTLNTGFAASSIDYKSYQATHEDFQAIQDGISGALKLQEKLFPNGIGNVDVVLYDSRYFYVYSRKQDYPLPKFRSWNEYTVYRKLHNTKISKRFMRICSVDAPTDIRKSLWKAEISALFFSCSPVTVQTAIQKQRKSIYDTRESYLGTIVHEYAHVYQKQELWQMPVIKQIVPLVKAIKSRHAKLRILQEAYAIWCENQASRELYPSHFKRLKSDYRPGYDQVHNHGQKVAMELMGLKVLEKVSSE